MEKIITLILAQLSQISVRGDDVERMATAMRLLRQLLDAWRRVTSRPAKGKEHVNA